MTATNPPNYNDQPIQQPEQDAFGIDPFAQAIAKGIQGIQQPNGFVIGINGK